MLIPLLHYITSLSLLTANPSFTPAANTPSISSNPFFCTPPIFGWYAVYMINDGVTMVCKAGDGCWAMDLWYILDLFAARAKKVDSNQDVYIHTISATPYNPSSPADTGYESEPHLLLSSDTSPSWPIYTTDPVDRSPEIDASPSLEKVPQAEVDRKLTIPSSDLAVSETPKKTRTRDAFGSIVLHYIKKVIAWNFGFRSFKKVKSQTPTTAASRTVDPMVALRNRLLWLEYAELFHTMAYIPGDTLSSPNYPPLEFASFYAGHQVPITPVPSRVLARLANRAAWVSYTEFFSTSDIAVMPFHTPLEFASFAAGKTSIKCISETLEAANDKRAISGGMPLLLLRAASTAFERVVASMHIREAVASTVEFLLHAWLVIRSAEKSLALSVLIGMAAKQYGRLVNALRSSDISLRFMLLFLIRAGLASIPVGKWYPTVLVLSAVAEYYATGNSNGPSGLFIPLFGFIGCLKAIVIVLGSLNQVLQGQIWDLAPLDFNFFLAYRQSRKKETKQLTGGELSDTVQVIAGSDVAASEHESEEADDQSSTEVDNSGSAITSDEVSPTTSNDSATLVGSKLTIDTLSIPDDVVTVDQLPSPPPSACALSPELPTLEDDLAEETVEDETPDLDMTVASSKKAPGIRIDTSSNVYDHSDDDHGLAQLPTPLPTPEIEPDRGRSNLPQIQRPPILRTHSVPPIPTATANAPIIAPVPLSAPSSSILQQQSFDNNLAEAHWGPDTVVTEESDGSGDAQTAAEDDSVVDEHDFEEDVVAHRTTARNHLSRVLEQAIQRRIALSSEANDAVVDDSNSTFPSEGESTDGDAESDPLTTTAEGAVIEDPNRSGEVQTTPEGEAVIEQQLLEDTVTLRTAARNRLFQVLDRGIQRRTGGRLVLSPVANTAVAEGCSFSSSSTSEGENTADIRESAVYIHEPVHHTRIDTSEALPVGGRGLSQQHESSYSLRRSSSLPPANRCPSPDLVTPSASAPSTSRLQQLSFYGSPVDLCEDAEIGEFEAISQPEQMRKAQMKAWTEEVIDDECQDEERSTSPASDLWARLQTWEEQGLERPKEGQPATSCGIDTVQLDNNSELELSISSMSTDGLPGSRLESIDEVQEVTSSARAAEKRSKVFRSHVLRALGHRVDSSNAPSPSGTPNKFDGFPSSPIDSPSTPYSQPLTP